MSRFKKTEVMKCYVKGLHKIVRYKSYFRQTEVKKNMISLLSDDYMCWQNPLYFYFHVEIILDILGLSVQQWGRGKGRLPTYPLYKVRLGFNRLELSGTRF